ncbi:hypothetical protein [Miniimonas sp. S16]|uniref:hypothetical protein n=1 Tax=Miniimonas sp. S16 TaxID=2171623 RepID=UPI001F3B03EB|nr:hypothetical protein [Miniimonas sp. S16]
MELKEYDATQYDTQMIADLAAGTAPDMYVQKNLKNFFTYQDGDQLLDVSDVAEGLSDDVNGVSAYEVDGATYAIPYRQDAWSGARRELRRPRRARGRTGDPRPGVPLHAGVRGAVAPPGRRARRAGRPRGRGPPHGAVPRTGRDHPGLGRPDAPLRTRPHHHRLAHEHAPAALGRRADR